MSRLAHMLLLKRFLQNVHLPRSRGYRGGAHALCLKPRRHSNAFKISPVKLGLLNETTLLFYQRQVHISTVLGVRWDSLAP